MIARETHKEANADLELEIRTTAACQVWASSEQLQQQQQPLRRLIVCMCVCEGKLIPSLVLSLVHESTIRSSSEDERIRMRAPLSSFLPLLSFVRLTDLLLNSLICNLASSIALSACLSRSTAAAAAAALTLSCEISWSRIVVKR